MRSVEFTTAAAIYLAALHNTRVFYEYLRKTKERERKGERVSCINCVVPLPPLFFCILLSVLSAEKRLPLYTIAQDRPGIDNNKRDVPSRVSTGSPTRIDKSSRWGPRGKSRVDSKHGNFSRKLQRMPDNDGGDGGGKKREWEKSRKKRTREAIFGEKVSDLRASIDVEGYSDGEGFCTVFWSTEGLLLYRDYAASWSLVTLSRSLSALAVLCSLRFPFFFLVQALFWQRRWNSSQSFARKYQKALVLALSFFLSFFFLLRSTHVSRS